MFMCDDSYNTMSTPKICNKCTIVQPKTPFPFKWRGLFNCCFNDNNMTCNRHLLTIYFLLPLISIRGRINEFKNKEISTLGIKKAVVIHFHGRLTHKDLRLLSQLWMARKVIASKFKMYVLKLWMSVRLFVATAYRKCICSRTHSLAQSFATKNSFGLFWN